MAHIVVTDKETGLPDLGFDRDDLLKLASWTMPFGKYHGRPLIQLPESYLLWFAKHGFPKGELGRLMQLSLSLKIDGLDGLLFPLIDRADQ